MSFWQKFLSTDQQYNEHKNQTSCTENDYACKSNEQLLNSLVKATDEDIIRGIKKVLISRGYSRKELVALIQPPVQ